MEKTALKKLVAKASVKVRAGSKKAPRPRMTVSLAEKHAIGNKDRPKFDSVAVLRSLR